MMNLIVPSLPTLSEGATQVPVVRLVFCCKLKPDEGDGHEIMTVLVAVS